MLKYAKEMESSEITERDKVRSDIQKREQKIVQFSSVFVLMKFFLMFAFSITVVGIFEVCKFSVFIPLFRDSIICHTVNKYAQKFSVIISNLV